MIQNLTIGDCLRNRICQNLNGFSVKPLDSQGRKRAAVAVTVVDQREGPEFGDLPFDTCDSNRAALILTIRASRLRSHAGQRAFPGGRVDPGETPEQTALRELGEEVGLQLEPGQVLGRLDDYPTRSGYVITPIVVWCGQTGKLEANPDEVASIHRIPVSELLRSDAPILERARDLEHPVLKMPLGNDWVAAPTAAIAYQFREVAILGQETRVAHYEQPRFAWK